MDGMQRVGRCLFDTFEETATKFRRDERQMQGLVKNNVTSCICSRKTSERTELEKQVV